MVNDTTKMGVQAWNDEMVLVNVKGDDESDGDVETGKPTDIKKANGKLAESTRSPY